MKNLLFRFWNTNVRTLGMLPIFICILLSCTMLFGQTTWTGAINNDWSIGGNWTAGVPDATDIVTIPNVMPNPSPAILNGTVALGRSVNISAGGSLQIQTQASLTLINEDGIPGIENNGSFVTSGTIIISTNNNGVQNLGVFQILTGQVTVANAVEFGISNGVGATFSNSGSVDIGGVGSNIIFGITNGGIFVNQQAGSMRVNRFGQNAITNGVLGSFTNLGNLEIGVFAGFGTYGFVNNGEFSNGENATLKIDYTSQIAVENKGTFNNSGIIHMGTKSNIGNGIRNESIFNHQGGEITINRVGFHPIFNISEAELYTNGILRIGNEELSASYGIENRGYIEHQSGEVYIDRFSLWGIHNHLGGVIINVGDIHIGSIATTGTNGIRNESIFTNSEGSIHIDRVSQTGILNNSATFSNLNGGFIGIGLNAPIGEHAIRQENSATFQNNGVVLLDRYYDAGWRNNSGLLTNNGQLMIGPSGEVSGWSLYNPTGTVINEPCKEMYFFSPVSLGENTFSNDGALEVFTTEPHVNISFTNRGIIGYRLGNPIPNVINENVISLPLFGDCNDIPNALELGTNVTYIISENWSRIVDNAFEPGGIYNQANNILSPGDIPQGTSLLDISYTDPVNACSNAIRTVITLNDEIPPTVECFDYELILNGELEVILDPINLAEASDNCGIPAISLSPMEIQCDMLGQVIPVTVTATDGNQTAQCISQVTVSGLPCGWYQHPDGINCQDGSSVKYDVQKETFEVSSKNCFYGPPFQNDAMAFAQYNFCGDGSLTVEVVSITGANAWAGILMRETNAAGSKKVQLSTNMNSNLTRREIRSITNGPAQPQQLPAFNRFWLKITRHGNQFIGQTSSNGVNWFQSFATNVTMNECIEFGMIVTNYNSNSTAVATFANVSIEGNINDSKAVVKLDQALASHHEATSDLIISPNPTLGEVNVDLSAYLQKDLSISVYGIHGQLMHFREINQLSGATEQLNLSEYPGGIYVVCIKSPGFPDVTKRIVKQ